MTIDRIKREREGLYVRTCTCTSLSILLYYISRDGHGRFDVIGQHRSFVLFRSFFRFVSIKIIAPDELTMDLIVLRYLLSLLLSLLLLFAGYCGDFFRFQVGLIHSFTNLFKSSFSDPLFF